MQSTISELFNKLHQTMFSDRATLKKRLYIALAQHKSGSLREKTLTDLSSAIFHSRQKADERLAKLPRPIFDDILPVNQKLLEIKELIDKNQVVIICGETGSGKTTQIPKICLELGRGVFGQIGHTQPRRLAARSVAYRIAQELNCLLGKEVGFKVRFSEKISIHSYIKLMTDGILLAETQTDRYLSAYDTIIIDEAHERSLNIDFLLGFLKQLLPKRPELKLIITSATIDAERFAKHFDGAPVLEVSGRTFTVEQCYRPLSRRDEDDAEIEMEQAIAEVAESFAHHGSGDMLVFLPGEREIRETADELRKKASLRHYEILPLFARLTNEDQQRIFKPSTGRRIVLATNIAETSLTVPGIRYVIDSGLARIKRYSIRAKVEQLHIEPISQAAARQRAGRCGRVEAGICVRLYSQEDFEQRPLFTDPEIVRSNLASVILRMAALHLGNIIDFPFLDAPSSRLIADGYQVLFEIGAVDADNLITVFGRQLARIPVDPKIARMLLAAHENSCLREVLILSAALSIQDPREMPFEAKEVAKRAHSFFADEKSDYLSYLALWDFFAKELQAKISNRQLIKFCHQHFLSHARMREWRELHAQLAQISAEIGLKINDKSASYEQIHQSLLCGLVSQIGMKSVESDDYLAARGVHFRIFPGSGLRKRKPKWIMAAELTETSKLYARCVAEINPIWVEKIAGHLIKKHYFEPHWDKARGEVVASERVTLYGLTLIPRRPISYSNIDAVLARELFIRGALVAEDYISSAPFFKHNKSLIVEVEKLEHKARRQDVLVDDEVLFAFYNELIPHDIVDAKSFEFWRKKIESEQPKYLWLTREYLMQHAAEHITEEQFPEHLQMPEGCWTLRYRFEPNHVLDGVSVDVPLPNLNQLDGARFEWLIPGMIREKLSLLIKSLPKQQRRNCVPVPEFITSFLSSGIDLNQPIIAQLTRFILRQTGVIVDAEAMKNIELPAHCHFNFRIIDDGKQEIGMGRDLLELQRQFGQAAQLSFRDSALEMERDDVQSWDFGELPVSIQFAREKTQLTGYPALVCEDDKIAIRLFDTEYEANKSHRGGVIRLIASQMKEQIKQLHKDLPNITTIVLQLRQVANIDELLADAIGAICDRAFIGDDKLPRNEADFNEQKNRARARLPVVKQTLSKILAQIANEYAKLTPRIKTHRLATQIDEQLSQLIYPGFLQATPWQMLSNLPRYLSAMSIRMDKQAENPNRDGQRAAEINELWQRWTQRVEVEKKRSMLSRELLDFRWQIEELRVSFFAQELKTAYPVSVKRLNKIWDALAG